MVLSRGVKGGRPRWQRGKRGSQIPVIGTPKIQSPPSRLYCARSIEDEASRAVNDAGWPPLIFPEAGPTLRSSTCGGVLSTSKRSLSRSGFNARAGGFDDASLATIFR